MHVEVEGSKGMESIEVKSLSDLVSVASRFLEGDIKTIEARPSHLMYLLGAVDDTTRTLPEGAHQIVLTNKSQLGKILEAHGAYAVASILALSGTTYRSDTAVINTARALRDFGPGPTQLALRGNDHSSVTIYEAVQDVARKESACRAEAKGL